MDTPIVDVLTSLGFTSEVSRHAARQLLEQHGLTNPSKKNFAPAKIPRVRECLAATVVRLCSEVACAVIHRRSGGDRTVIPADRPTQCEVCGGSNQRRTVLLMGAALKDARIRRLLVVGGTPDHQRLLRETLQPTGIEVRTVVGDKRAHNQTEANQALAWADLVLIWGGTALNHKLSQVYTRPATPARRVQVPGPGLDALCRTAIATAQGRAAA